MTHPQVVVAVPARLESARLPGKLLAEIAGKPMLQHVLERCQQARGVAAVLVCTDSEQVRHLAHAWGVSVLMTSPTAAPGVSGWPAWWRSWWLLQGARHLILMKPW